ncbi:hypothetical protein GF312_04355 [Candidatus Poribacteria bacterium]|nr:hypothetical protein [Candidatus Poribacteria bacterium]
MFWKKKKQKKQPKLIPYTQVTVKYEPVTPEQIAAYLIKQQLWKYLIERNAGYSSGQRRNNYPDDTFYDPLREFDKALEDFDAEFQRRNDEFERPIRKMEEELANMSMPNLGDIKVEDGIAYMATSVYVKNAVRQVYDP